MAGPCKTYGPQFALQDIECPGVDEMPKLRGCPAQSVAAAATASAPPAAVKKL